MSKDKTNNKLLITLYARLALQERRLGANNKAYCYAADTRTEILLSRKIDVSKALISEYKDIITMVEYQEAKHQKELAAIDNAPRVDHSLLRIEKLQRAAKDDLDSIQTHYDSFKRTFGKLSPDTVRVGLLLQSQIDRNLAILEVLTLITEPAKPTEE